MLLVALALLCTAGQSKDVADVVQDAANTMKIAKFATLATVASDGSINGRMVYPRPPNATGEPPDIRFVHFATNRHSRKYREVLANPQATLVYYDDAGKGEVALKGTVVVCNTTEATQGWYDRWRSNYPLGPETPMYSLLRFEVRILEFVSYVRYCVDEGGNRSDWRPLTLERIDGGDWQYVAPPLETDAQIE
mmetsp:Transcript_1257/g.3557  ORF Transcript_1257/g.3557 Transcript_1257/m.3557 type:complete len:193 (-) Transcript_1257:10-588(-)